MSRSIRVTGRGPRTLIWPAIATSLVVVWVSRSGAFPTYSSGVDDRCRECHGDFRAGSYISPSDGENWGNLHNLHRNVMLSNDCLTCHTSPGEVPVFTNFSGGGEGFEPIGCIGCHGRSEDDTKETGPGAGLRQHHFRAGVTVCTNCHFDADPANYTPVGEDVAPPYYFLPDPAHPNKPTDPCSPNGEENYAGIGEGLDNDGDEDYDTSDSDCGAGVKGDANGDGCVDFADVLVVLNEWGQMGGGLPGDVTGDMTVDFADLLLVLANWASGC